MKETEEKRIITQPNVGYVDSPEQLDKLLDLVEKAQVRFQTYQQDVVDKIFQHCAVAANQHRVSLAELAVKEAGMGNIEDKTIKNHFSAETVYNAYKETKTCGIVEEDLINGYSLYAEPVGILAGIVPCTNPTSTTIFKALIALKTRNCIVFAPHPRTVKCTIEAARIIRDAAIKVGAPENCIGWIDQVSITLCNVLMRHPKVAMIVATGAGGLIKSAYSSGKPCTGGSSGNTPVIIDESADISLSINSILLSKTFDHGMICASEQAVIAVESVADKVKEEFIKRGGYFLKDDYEKEQLAAVLFKENGALNPEAVGQPAYKLMQLAQFKDPPCGSRVILAELNDIGPETALSREKLCPCLGFYRAKNYDEALELALRLVRFGGLGHTSVLYTDLNAKDKKERISKFEAMMPTGRALLCMPTSQGAIGGLFNPKQAPSMSLGCGSWGGNSSAEGLQPKHLLNYKQVAERRDQAQSFTVPSSVCFGSNVYVDAIKQLKTESEGIQRVGILFEPYMMYAKRKEEEELRQWYKSIKTSLVETLTTTLQQQLKVKTTLLSEEFILYSHDLVKSFNKDSSCCCAYSRTPFLYTSVIMKAAEEVSKLELDALIAIGDTYTLDASKLIRLAVEHPKIHWEYLGIRFMSLTQRIINFPELGQTIKKLVCIPTTSGSGAEMSPYALVIHDLKDKEQESSCPQSFSSSLKTLEHQQQTQCKREKQSILTLIDKTLVPDIAIVDYTISHSMPKHIALETGCVALSNAFESLVSLTSSEHTRKLSKEALQLLTQNLIESVTLGSREARSECHRAASIVGMASANCFLGINTSLSHQLTKQFDIPSGIAKIMLLCQVIMFNAEEAPSKLACFPQYEKPKAKSQYVEVIKTLEIFPKQCTEDEYIQILIQYLCTLKKKLSIPLSIQQYGIDEKKYFEVIDVMALNSFDDQFTATNPRYPLITELTQLLIDAYYGQIKTLRYDEAYLATLEQKKIFK